MNNSVNRREFLAFVGGTSAVAGVGTLTFSGSAAAHGGHGSSLLATPVRLPHPLNIYTQRDSFLASGIGSGNIVAASASPELTTYTVIDDVVVPPEYERYVIIGWGDRVFPSADDYVGYNHDYTAYVPLLGDRDGLLWVNHEYTSYPMSVYTTTTPGLQALGDAFATYVDGSLLPPLPAGGFPALSVDDQVLVLGELLYNTGGSVVRIRRQGFKGRFEPVMSGWNRRYHGLSGLAINSERTGSAYPTSWGIREHQQGDRRYFIGTGPAARDVFEGVNADGLGNRIIGTFANCSGALTPWGTIMSAEENFQVFGNIGVQEAVLPTGTQTGFPPVSASTPRTTADAFGLYGEKYGWLVEIDPRNPLRRGRKHTALGRFRHENIAIRAAPLQKLVAYMGDDRRGGHVWKYVSKDRVGFATWNPLNSRLLEEGTLFVARFNADGTGNWIPLRSDTATNPNVPSELGSAELAARGAIDRSGGTRLPRRNGIAGQTGDGGSFVVTTANEVASLPDYRNKTLADFYPTQGAILVDAFQAANLIGGTPAGRPEDIEVHPDTNAVFIAFTDGVAGSDGYPDSRIFQVGKYSTAVNAKQPPGGLYKIVESSPSGTGLSFRWSKFALGGEEGAVDGVGFAAVDNLAFDSRGNVWGVIDMSTELHNGFGIGATPQPTTITHSSTAPADASALFGIYGNNWLLYIPTSGPNAGTVVPFAVGPTRSEMTGPTFVGNDHLLISVQHPGEDSPIGALAPLNRDIEILRLDGSATFVQNRTVPAGSAWPANISREDGGNDEPAGLPRPVTIGIRRKPGRRGHDDFDNFV